MKNRHNALMLTQGWQTSPHAYETDIERSISIPVSDGITLDARMTRPVTDAPVPAILSAQACPQEDQFTDLIPEAFSHTRGHLKAGDREFFARRQRTLLQFIRC